MRTAPTPGPHGSSDKRHVLLLSVLAILATMVGTLLAAPIAAYAFTTVKVNFQPATSPIPAGYVADTGLGFSSTRGYGWTKLADNTPADLSAYTRDRHLSDPVLGTLIHMQYPGGTPGRWQYVVPNGTYAVTVSVGDGGSNGSGGYCCLDSVDRITVEEVLTVNDFVPTATTPFKTATSIVKVSDGLLTVDAIGGSNTKLDAVTIAPSTATPQATTPRVTSTTPAAGATNVAVNTSVSLAITAPVNPSTISQNTVQLIGPAGQVAGTYNSDAAGGTVSFTPDDNLTVSTTYTIKVTSGLQSSDGRAFATYQSSFTTGASAPSLSPDLFTKAAVTPVPKPTVLAIGPDNRLWVGTAKGYIVRYARNANGTLGASESIRPFGDRLITGFAFDPLDKTKLYVTNTYDDYANAPRYSGRISLLTLPANRPLAAATVRDVIVGLPRSMHDHMTNGIAFGPDGRLYIAQGANTAYGASDPYWGTRGEEPLSASILAASVHDTTKFPTTSAVNVNTDPVGTTEDTGSAPAVGYNPKATGAPVVVYASGTRNPFTLVWASNGKLYAPVNESAAGGATPAGPGGTPPALTNLPAYNDYFTRITAGKYYGHPNPTQGYYTLNGGNPTSSIDPFEVAQYPVGTAPNANWIAPDMDMGVHRSPDGAAEYKSSTAFAGDLKGKFLVTEYSNGDDLLAVTLDANGKPVRKDLLGDTKTPGQQLIFDNPLAVATDPVTGDVYVSEYLNEGDPTQGQVTLLKPGNVDPNPDVSLRVNFQPTSTTVPANYTADTGKPFDGRTGWVDSTGAPVDLSASTRVRNSTGSPDARYDTMLLMQAVTGTTSNRWITSLPNGSYDVTVAVGDATALNSVDRIVAQPGTSASTVIIGGYTPTAAAPFTTVTKRVSVMGGRLTLDATGGTNTKIDFVDIVSVPNGSDALPPTATIDLSGTLVSPGVYANRARATITADDNVGVASLTYSVDGGAATVYTGPVDVTTAGQHTITATAKDAAGNVGTAKQTFTVQAAAFTAAHVDFTTPTGPVASGYVADTGGAYDSFRGYGWEDQSTGAPLTMSGNTRVRNSTLSPDVRYDTLLQMQQTASSTTGTQTPGKWEYAVPSGTYDVTVAVGDATATNSVYAITAERGTANATTVVPASTPTSSTLFFTKTARVAVTDGRLTLDGIGGTNDKICFVDIVKVA